MQRATVVEVALVQPEGAWDLVTTCAGSLRCQAGKWHVGDLAVWVEDGEFVFLSVPRHDWPLGSDVWDVLDHEEEE